MDVYQEAFDFVHRKKNPEYIKHIVELSRNMNNEKTDKIIKRSIEQVAPQISDIIENATHTALGAFPKWFKEFKLDPPVIFNILIKLILAIIAMLIEGFQPKKVLNEFSVEEKIKLMDKLKKYIKTDKLDDDDAGYKDVLDFIKKKKYLPSC